MSGSGGGNKFFSVPLRWAVLLLIGVGSSGCVERLLVVRSEPSGALVELDEQEVGRTPLQREFLWYGTYDVTVSKQGYEAIKTTAKLRTPWFEIIPIDLFAQIAPFRIRVLRKLNYFLKPYPPPTTRGSARLMERAEQLRLDEQAGNRFPIGSTQPSRAGHRSASRPATSRSSARRAATRRGA